MNLVGPCKQAFWPAAGDRVQEEDDDDDGEHEQVGDNVDDDDEGKF